MPTKAIASGALRFYTQFGSYLVAAETGTADNLDNVTLKRGGSILIQPDAGDTITIRDTGGGTGNIRTPGNTDLVLTDTETAVLVGDGTLVWAFAQAGGGGTGTVTSVGLSTNASYLTIGSTPVTSSGTITANKTTGLTANQVVATPNGAPGAADLRSLVAADYPTMVGDSGSGGTKGAAPAPAAGDTAAGKFLKADGTWAAPSGSGAPSTATYITQTPDSGLSAEQALSALATGLLKSTTTTGVLSIAANTDIPAFTGDSGSGGTAGGVPAPASGDAAAGKFLKSSGAWAVPSGGGASVLLDYVAATDIASPAAMTTAGTWYDVGTNQSFTVTDASKAILISVRGMILVGNTSSENASRIVIDSAGTPINKPVGGSYTTNTIYGNALSGSGTIYVSGLSAAAHTVKVQVVSQSNSQNAYCRPATVLQESLGILVVQV